MSILNDFFTETPASTKMLNTKKLVALILVITSVLFIFYLAEPSLIGYLSQEHKDSEKTDVLSMALYQSVNYRYADLEYQFRYLPAGQGKLLTVSSGSETLNYPALPGATYSPFNLKVTITSATENLIIIQITHT